MGKVWIIADTTYRETVRQPLYYILLGSFAAIIYLSRYFTLFAFREGDEANMVREMGVASITICGLLISVVMSSLMITSEVEKLTTLTVLSKPVGRGQFLLGKYFGIMFAVFFAVALLTAVFLLTLWTKEMVPKLQDNTDLHMRLDSGNLVTPEIRVPLLGPVAIPREFQLTVGAYDVLHDFWTLIAPPVLKATILALFQIGILASLAVAFAPHFSLAVNASAAFVLFAIGHLTPYILLKAQASSPAWSIPVRVVCLVFPNLGYFNTASLLATRSEISMRYVAAAAGYGVLYAAAVLLVAVAFFSRKEVR